MNYKRRYNLDVALKEYEAEFGPTTESGEGEDVDMKEENGDNSNDSPKTSLPNSPRSKSPATTAIKVNGSGK